MSSEKYMSPNENENSIEKLNIIGSPYSQNLNKTFSLSLLNNCNFSEQIIDDVIEFYPLNNTPPPIIDKHICNIYRRKLLPSFLERKEIAFPYSPLIQNIIDTTRKIINECVKQEIESLLEIKINKKVITIVPKNRSSTNTLNILDELEKYLESFEKSGIIFILSIRSYNTELNNLKNILQKPPYRKYSLALGKFMLERNEKLLIHINDPLTKYKVLFEDPTSFSSKYILPQYKCFYLTKKIYDNIFNIDTQNLYDIFSQLIESYINVINDSGLTIGCFSISKKKINLDLIDILKEGKRVCSEFNNSRMAFIQDISNNKNFELLALNNACNILLGDELTSFVSYDY